MEEKVRKAVEEALNTLGTEGVSFVVERPGQLAHGDYATNVALSASKKLGKNPLEFAKELAGKLRESLNDVVSKVDVAGPGFINITLASSVVEEVLADIHAKGEEWGKGTTRASERVMIEYSNPNAFKEMHIGHLVGTVIGETISRLVENEGATIKRDTFGGDIGPNVAKALWGLQKAGTKDPQTAKEIGTAYTEGANAYETDPKAKEEIDAINLAVYAGTDAELMDLWKKGREISMREFRRIWKLLGTKFDYEFFDSDTTELGLAKVQEGLERGVFKESEGAIIYSGEEKGVHTMVFITSHNTPTYETKDIGLAFLKEKQWNIDRVIVVAGNEQTGRFKTVLSALSELAPDLASKTTHIPHGFLNLAEGKMSSRKGNVITSAELIDAVIERAREKNEDVVVAEQVAVGAIKYMILRQAPGTDIIFDAEKSLSLDGDSGPYLQYALVRAKSVIEKSEQTGRAMEHPQEPYAIERHLLHFPEVTARASREYAPHLLTTYLTELAGVWNSFYAKERIVGGDYEAYKVNVARAFVQTMENGLTLLGIPTPEKM
jgi:arginyl-tRNA synthetase